jgi:hypothetical protein
VHRHHPATARTGNTHPLPADTDPATTQDLHARGRAPVGGWGAVFPISACDPGRPTNSLTGHRTRTTGTRTETPHPQTRSPARPRTEPGPYQPAYCAAQSVAGVICRQSLANARAVAAATCNCRCHLQLPLRRRGRR